MTDDLITWLRAQLDEDEARFRDASGDPWLDSLQRWVLADIEAKRAILDELCEYDQVDVTLPGGPPETMRGRRAVIAGPLARLIASAYAERPGYREEWRP